MNDMLEHALRIASGLGPVLPLHTPDPEHRSGCSCMLTSCTNIGKHPRNRAGLTEATTDPDTIARWWRLWPEANVGMRTGEGLVVFDVDPRNGGDESLRRVVQRYGAPGTLAVRTGGGGMHYYFRGDLPTKKLEDDKLGPLPGLDLKGRGGYVVSPPSLHESGDRYMWDTSVRTIAPVPKWLADMAKGKKGGGGLAPAVTDSIPEGGRHDALVSIAGTLRRRGLVTEEILPCLEAVNALRCDPPMEEHEVRTIAESMMSYTPAMTTGELAQATRAVLTGVGA